MFKEDLFKGKTAFVTGGGSGIGFAISKQLLSLGAEVYIASRKKERIDEAVMKLQKYGNCKGFVLDIRQPDNLEHVADSIKHQSGKLDILVNNAGGQFPSKASEISVNGWNAVINTNLNGTFYTTRQMYKSFFEPQQSGNIVNIIANIYRGFVGMAHTGAARAGVDNLTKTLAVEWARTNVNINAIAPGIIKSSGLDQYPEDLMSGITDKIPMRRLGTVEEVADLVCFMASPMAKYITGETVYIDGGSRLWGDIWSFLV